MAKKFISNDRTSASKKINRMALVRTLTVSTTAFERTKEKLDGFRQTAFVSELGLIGFQCASKPELPENKYLYAFFPFVSELGLIEFQCVLNGGGGHFHIKSDMDVRQIRV